MTVTEAGACGTPAVVTRIAGHIDAVEHDRSGLIVDGRDDMISASIVWCATTTCVRGSRQVRSTTPPASRGRRRHWATLRCSRRGAAPPAFHPEVTTARHAPRVSLRGATSVLDGLSERSRRRLGYALLALLSYVPLLLTAPGRVAADTKQYLYLDPGRLLERAPSMWDPNIGLGTVTHQNIGYLFPMGPFYWVFDVLGFPDWVAQRLWLGTIIFFAGLGVLYLMRTLGVRGPGVPAAALVYMLSPYLLDFSARISVILLPFAGLPWLLALVMRALRSGRWREPGDLRHRRADRRRRERHRARLRRPRRCAVDPVRRLGHTRGRLATRARDDSAHRRAHVGRVAVVDRGTVDPERLRPQRAQVHRDARGRLTDVDGARAVARPRVLVLLRS